ncbi:unnamed protein product [Lactuca virosa]|uniref:Uncharacterized protein n=1 Tax=Lactuca virosa TaxID=75947 RepID=A0AAU9M4W0_9ASTR|nr:unnamed protein product [Lactuca virosa]
MPQFFMSKGGDKKLLSLEQVLRGNFGGDLEYHEVPLVEALLSPATVGPAPKCEASPAVARAEDASPSKGSGVPSFQVVSRRRSAVVDYALREDVGGDTSGRRLLRKHNIEPFLAKSPVVIEIADGDELSAAEAVCSHRQGKTTVTGGCSTSPLALDDNSSKRGKQAVLVLSSGSGSSPSEPGVVARSTDAIHAAIRDLHRRTSHLISDWASLVLLISTSFVLRRRTLFQTKALRAACECNLFRVDVLQDVFWKRHPGEYFVGLDFGPKPGDLLPSFCGRLR